MRPGYDERATPSAPHNPRRPNATGAVAAGAASVGVDPASHPEDKGSGGLEGLVELAGPNATVRVMDRDMKAQPVEEIPLATYIARLRTE